MKYFRKKIITVLSLLVILAVIPATLFVTQQKTQENSNASASTQLYLSPNTTVSVPQQVNVGNTVSFDVMINPGTNLPSVVKLVLQYDPTKFQASTTPFTVNASAFPSTLEGPIVQNGMVVASVSIGSDVTKAISTVTKVGTLTLTAIAPTTTGASTVSFGANSQVLSVASADQSNENVLSTTTPAYIMINATANPTVPLTLAPTATSVPPTAVQPTTLLSPSQSVSPTVFATLVPLPTISPTQIPPTQVLQPTPTLAPATSYLTFTVFLHGIGNSGDNANPDSSTLSNKNPVRQQRNVTAYVYNDQNQLTATQTGTITYDSTNGDYTGNVDFGNSIPDGYYTVLLKEDTHLRKSVPGIIHITPQQNNTMPAVTLVTGDVNSDNIINILDYNILIGCYSDLLPAVSCNANSKVISDLNDDGFVNQTDYNLFLREITVQNGN
jgi:hypothetical protein